VIKSRLKELEMTPYFQALRPEQWIKSGFCLAALFFSGQVGVIGSWELVWPLIVAFSLMASAGYVFNDFWNLKEDQAHPRKRHRAIASGQVSPSAAIVLFVLCIVLALGFSIFYYRFELTTGCLTLYLIVNLLYTILLRKIPFLDVTSISFGFVLRVIAGAFALGLFPSEWLMIITYLLALLLGLGKRSGELNNLKQEGINIGITRNSLGWYQKVGISRIIWTVVFLIVVSYGVYCYKVRGQSPVFGLTCIPVIIALISYAKDSSFSKTTERPEQMIFTRPIIGFCLIAWGTIVIFTVR